MLGNHVKNKKMKTVNQSKGQQGLSATFVAIAAAFCVCLIVSNIFVPRTWQVWGLDADLPGAIILFPISYILNDCLTEVYGYRKARFVIWLGFALNAFIALASWIVTMLPAPLDDGMRAQAESFNSLFAFVPKSTIASMLAFICGSTANAWVMSKMKLASKGKRFGWRAIVSSLVGESIDSIVFIPFVFLSFLPLKVVLTMMVTQVAMKTLYEVVILPVTTIFVKALKKKEGIDTFDEGISYNPFKISDI